MVLFCFVYLKRITEEIVYFVCNSIVYRRRMVKYIYVIKPRFIKAILLWQMLLEVGENTF